MNFKRTNEKNLREFKTARGVYVAEPLVEFTHSWTNFDDVHDMRNATTLYFETLKGNELYAKHLLREGNHYWKLFIVSTKQIHILYVPASSLNPIRLYRR